MISTAAQSRVLLSTQGHPILHHRALLDGRLFEVQWQTTISLDDAIVGVRFMFDQMVRLRTKALLSDSLRNSLDWSELIPLLRYEEYPRAVAAGLRWRASVVAINPMDALGHYQLGEEITDLMINRFFHTVEEARAWLLEQLGEKPATLP